MKSPLLCIVVLNWNGAGDTIECLHSLSGELSPSCMVLVVDNGSTDDSLSRIRAAFPDTELLSLPLNLGYAGGNNAGFRRVMELQAEFVLFLNNDTLVERGFSAPLIHALRSDPSAGIAVPKIFYHARPHSLWYAGGVVRLSTGLIRHTGIRKADGPEFNRPGVTGYATGCCFSMRCRDFERVGGFDEHFGMYAEDVDLSLRVRALGLNVRYEPGSVVWHKVSASLSGTPFKKLAKKSAASLRLFIKHRAWGGVLLFLLLLPFRLAVSSAAALLERAFAKSTRIKSGHEG